MKSRMPQGVRHVIINKSNLITETIFHECLIAFFFASIYINDANDLQHLELDFRKQ